MCVFVRRLCTFCLRVLQHFYHEVYNVRQTFRRLPEILHHIVAHLSVFQADLRVVYLGGELNLVWGRVKGKVGGYTDERVRNKSSRSHVIFFRQKEKAWL